MQAAVGALGDLCFKALSLGVVTPGAAQRTALEKYGHADSRTVIGRKLLYGKDFSVYHFLTPSMDIIKYFLDFVKKKLLYSSKNALQARRFLSLFKIF